MANQVEPELTKPIFDFLQKERFVLLATIDHETSGPNVSAISWVMAKDEKTILFAVDNRSRIVANIKQNPKAVINVMVNESTYSISGDARIEQDKMTGVPLKLALVQMDVAEVRDVMFYGSKLTVLPEYDKTYDLKAAKRLDNQVMSAIKKA
ncbi:pyridoxamine 5'-phosphate oxidase family protein [Bacillus tuaregi]|uniref:pyridoxamine 5'-phosphate oxidase family protein n=1 Tax=Bacillus tuaregi TaxID=1816695 RepID=UPI0008F89DF6|nr:pyridoxamine 5'-phosphate oxidase family protein [Bacillus tuaregi]